MYRKIERNGNTYFISSSGSMAIVQGKFYIDGKKALEGQYSFSLIDGIEMIINVDAESQVINNV